MPSIKETLQHIQNVKFSLSFLIWSIISGILIYLINSGHPFPHVDDLIFIGSSINLTKQNVLENPYCSGFLQQFGTIKHYYYLPFHAFTLGQYLKIVGISTISILSFQWFFLLLGIFSTYLLAKNVLKQNETTATISGFIFLIIFIQTGLRPDAMGFGITLFGLSQFGRTHINQKFLGIFLCGIGFISAPLSIGIALPMTIYIMYHQPLPNLKSYNRLFIIAALWVVLIFSYTIQFNYSQFWGVFLKHKQFLGDESSSFQFFVWLITENYQKVLKLPLYLFCLGILILQFLRKDFQSIYFRNTFILIVAIIFSAFLYTEKTALHIGIFIGWLLIISFFNSIPKPIYKVAYSLILFSYFIVSQSSFILTCIYQESFQQTNKSEIINMLQFNPQKTIYVDSEAARYIFDYDIPLSYKSLNFFDNNFSPKSISQHSSNSIWVFSNNLVVRNKLPITQKNITKIQFLGKNFNSLPEYPFEIGFY